MELREAIEGDIPHIVNLLKVSLGEELMPKSEAFWRWKHIDNPFGPSPVLIALDEGKLVGVRAFMRWEWILDNKVLKAVRAVDTVTHPAYQGKGIFKKLTLALVDQSKKEGVDFIFNTPNGSSKPGYLKMGWVEQGRMPVRVRPVISFNRKKKNFESEYPIVISAITTWMSGHQHCRHPEAIATNTSESFFNWRYIRNPNIRYFSFSDDGSSYITIFRLKPGRLGLEFRICDVLHTCDYDVTSFKKKLLQAATDAGAFLITYSGASIALQSIGLKMGPMVTVRHLSMNNSLSFDFWKPTLGDMEVF